MLNSAQIMCANSHRNIIQPMTITLYICGFGTQILHHLQAGLLLRRALLLTLPQLAWKSHLGALVPSGAHASLLVEMPYGSCQELQRSASSAGLTLPAHMTHVLTNSDTSCKPPVLLFMHPAAVCATQLTCIDLVMMGRGRDSYGSA